MLRSLFAAVSGMRVNQTALDVTGNNIANANTTGYKATQTVFRDTLSQMLTGATGARDGANGATGGTNAIQIGLGVQLAGAATSFTQGQAQLTNNPTDLMINGDGFFVTQKGGETLYTRAGAFRFDGTGNLVTPDGAIVQNPDGEDINVEGIVASPPTVRSFSIGKDGVITGVMVDGSLETLGQVATATFPNPAGLEKVGSTAFRATVNSGEAAVGVPDDGPRGGLSAGQLEMSNVDLAQEFTNLIISQRGFQASSRVVSTSDQVLEELVNLKR